MPNLYIIAGCNGAGDLSASFAVFPEMLDCDEFINADEIARGISPLNPKKAIRKPFKKQKSGDIKLHYCIFG